MPLRLRPLARHAPDECGGRIFVVIVFESLPERLGVLLEGHNLAAAAAGGSITVEGKSVIIQGTVGFIQGTFGLAKHEGGRSEA